MQRGKFVSFEGIEGCGKTTQIALLSEYLSKHRIPFTITREPGGTAVGEGIRKILLNSERIRLTAASEWLLFYASRSQNIQEKIKPALQRNEMVICDRYYHASMAYQGYGRAIPPGFLFQTNGYFVSVLSPIYGLSGLRTRHSAGFHSQTDGSCLRSIPAGPHIPSRYRT